MILKLRQWDLSSQKCMQSLRNSHQWLPKYSNSLLELTFKSPRALKTSLLQINMPTRSNNSWDSSKKISQQRCKTLVSVWRIAHKRTRTVPLAPGMLPTPTTRRAEVEVFLRQSCTSSLSRVPHQHSILITLYVSTRRRTEVLTMYKANNSIWV